MNPSCSPFAWGFRLFISLIFIAFMNAQIPLTSAGPMADGLTVVNLRTEYKENPLGLDVLKPRLSWHLQSDRRGVLQTAYQLQVALNETDLTAGRNLLWDSNKVTSDSSIQNVYAGPALQSGRRYCWRVRVWDDRGESSWSQPACWEMGLLNAADWKASWVEPRLKEDVSKSQPAPMLRGTFKVNGEVQEARAYVTSHGLYELHLNGQRVGDQVFTPGWTSYHKRLQYQTYDVTGLLTKGDNVAGVVVGDGWYRGNLGFGGERNVYGNRLALLLQIQIKYADGRQEIVGSNSNWKATPGPS